MNCIVDNSLIYYLKKNKSLEVIGRYIRMKYRISMDNAALRARARSLQGLGIG